MLGRIIEARNGAYLTIKYTKAQRVVLAMHKDEDVLTVVLDSKRTKELCSTLTRFIEEMVKENT